MMKKAISSLFVFAFAVSTALAAVGETVPSTGDSSTKFDVKLNLSGSGDDAQNAYEIGFSSTPVSSGEGELDPTPVDAAILSLDGSKAILDTLNPENDVYIYWKIWGGQKITINLQLDGQLSGETVENQDKLDWSVSWVPVVSHKDGDDYTVQDSVTLIATEVAPTKEEVVFNRSIPSQAIEYGSTKITSIETGDITRITPDIYAGTITLVISPYNT